MRYLSFMEELKTITLFADLPDNELRHLSSLLLRTKIAKGQNVTLLQDQSCSLILIQKGKMKVSVVEGSKELTLVHAGVGHFLGEIALLTGERRSASLSAITDVEYFLLSREAFLHHTDQFPGLLHSLLKHLALRLRSSTGMICDFAFLDVYCRVQKTLERTAVVRADGYPSVEDRPTHQELANMVGSSREVVTRALHALEEMGVIEVKGKRITLLKGNAE
jgi:CRP/FNR family transcriptional regulator, cyclic AMP receptor protein